MRIYNDNYKGIAVTLLCGIESTDFNTRYILTPIFEFTSVNCGNVYRGSSKRKGLRKSGEFFKIEGKFTLVEEAPIYYA